MKALTVTPGTKNSARLREWADATENDPYRVKAAPLLLGVCGTDREIMSGAYGTAPAGDEFLVLGHECLARVESAPADSGFSAGDLVVPIVRRPDPVPCESCAVGEWDMCRNGQYTECGIKERHGFCREYIFIEPEFLIKVSASLRHTGVLVEPASIVAKAWEQIYRIGSRTYWQPKRVLITGAGPVGMLAAMMGRQRGLDVIVFDIATGGPKPALVQALGATYCNNDLTGNALRADIIMECTGVSSVLADVLRCNTRNALVCLMGLSTASREVPLDVARFNQSLVLENDVVFGSVNANRRHYEQAAASLAQADSEWLKKIITRVVPFEQWQDAIFQKHSDDVKVVIEIHQEATHE